VREVAPDHVRLAYVGYGKIAPKHLEVFRALGASFVASANRSESGRARARDEGGISNTYASISEMLERERPDGILCCPSFSHVYEAMKEALPFGIPTLVEKPPGTSVEQLRDLDALAQHFRVPVMVGLNRRHYSVLARAIQDAGGLEAITTVLVEWSEDPQHVLRRFTREEVERWIFGNTLHGLDMMTEVAGPIDQPQVIARHLGDPFRWLMVFQGLSRRGALVSFHSTWDSPGKWRFTFASRGRRYVFAPLETCTVLEAGGTTREIEPSEEDRRFKAGFYAQAKAFLETIRRREAPLSLSLSSALPAMELAERLTEAVLKSAAGRDRDPDLEGRV
jgi:predicted dehydrogenase